jgi:hypothetical protein
MEIASPRQRIDQLIVLEFAFADTPRSVALDVTGDELTEPQVERCRAGGGPEVPYVMRQVGHADPNVTLSIYAQVMYRREGERERLQALVRRSRLGTGGHQR